MHTSTDARRGRTVDLRLTRGRKFRSPRPRPRTRLKVSADGVAAHAQRTRPQQCARCSRRGTPPSSEPRSVAALTPPEGRDVIVGTARVHPRARPTISVHWPYPAMAAPATRGVQRSSVVPAGDRCSPAPQFPHPAWCGPGSGKAFTCRRARHGHSAGRALPRARGLTTRRPSTTRRQQSLGPAPRRPDRADLSDGGRCCSPRARPGSPR